MVRTTRRKLITGRAGQAAPDEIVSVDLQSAVASAKPELPGKTGAFGSAVFPFEGNSATGFAASFVRREGRQIDFHFDYYDMRCGNLVGPDG